MMNLAELKRNHDLCAEIDWDMTPEEAVRLYLEWGNNWASGNYVIRSKNDISHYFVTNTWGKEPIIYLVRRNEEKAEELAKIKIPKDILAQYSKTNGNRKGVFSLDTKMKEWLKNELN